MCQARLPSPSCIELNVRMMSLVEIVYGRDDCLARQSDDAFYERSEVGPT